jgi:hypothetical protein
VTVGVFTDLFNTATTFSPTGAGVHRVITHELQALSDLLGDPVAKSTDGVTVEVQKIKQYSSNPAAPATFTLTFNLYGGVTFTTAAIVFGANAATIQTAVDTAASGPVSGYTAGDIAVTGGALTAADVTLTFSGASVVNKQHSQTTITSTVPAFAAVPVTTTTPGDGSHDEVQSILAYANTPASGTFTLTLNFAGKTPITTAAIAYSANAATVQTAINVAVTAAGSNKPAGWTNDDVAVTNGPLTSSALTLTFSGTSVTHVDQGLSSVSGTSLVVASKLASPSSTTTTEGQAARTAWSVLEYCGIIGGTVPAQGSDADAISDASGFIGNPHRLSEPTIKAIALQAARDDGNDDVYGQICTALGITP